LNGIASLTFEEVEGKEEEQSILNYFINADYDASRI
jgi:hypothetical protein